MAGGVGGWLERGRLWYCCCRDVRLRDSLGAIGVELGAYRWTVIDGGLCAAWLRKGCVAKKFLETIESTVF